ncbi:MAG: formate dehydrogenase accessory sulfurtransferase FdhD [Paucibacter sp.]|nr:formate dehydrogenase accessory sulfurtransferase FdhD [Roseateles sp.]
MDVLPVEPESEQALTGLQARVVHDGGARQWLPAALQSADGRLDQLAEEVPVALVFNGISHAVMMCSPLDLEDFALGFGLSEGLLGSPAELLDVSVQESSAGIELQMTVTAACQWRLKARRRTMAGRTGCGLCGLESLQQVQHELPAAPTLSVDPLAIQLALRSLRQHQVLQQRSGATHAAALCHAAGHVLALREDVGRHNALDKLIGAVHREHLDVAGGFACITSRASFEMVQKALALGVGALVAVSAPTARAVGMADALNLALAGFARGDAFVAYTYPERFGAR